MLKARTNHNFEADLRLLYEMTSKELKLASLLYAIERNKHVVIAPPIYIRFVYALRTKERSKKSLIKQLKKLNKLSLKKEI